jgi:hypothetical protein
MADKGSVEAGETDSGRDPLEDDFRGCMGIAEAEVFDSLPCDASPSAIDDEDGTERMEEDAATFSAVSAGDSDREAGL